MHSALSTKRYLVKPDLFTHNLRKEIELISAKQSLTNKTQFAYSIGADPELFLVDGKGEFRSAHDLVPGSKLMPFHVSKGAIQPDGTSAEFNINPALTEEEFLGNIKSVLKDLQKTIREKDPSLNLRVSPVAIFDKEYFSKLPGEALAFGCTPDFNAWDNGKMTEFEGTEEPFRTGAGHVHIGWTEREDPADMAHMYDCIEATKQLDAILYPMSLLWDKDNKRRQLYGKMGAFRPKSYGVEYRPLSNAWLADPDLQRWVFRASVKAMQLLDNKIKQVKLWLDKDVKKFVDSTLKGEGYYTLDLRKLHEIFTDDFGFAPLPPAYRKP